MSQELVCHSAFANRINCSESLRSRKCARSVAIRTSRSVPRDRSILIYAMRSSVFFPGAAILLLLSANASSGLASEECTLDSAGHVACIHREIHGGKDRVESDLIASVRAEESSADYCVKSTDITNEIRRRHRGKGKYMDQGEGDLMTGTESMLANCISHSKNMADYLGMEHQDLSQATAEVGCDLFITGENVAWFGDYPEDTDPAVQCMKQWEESEGHLDNIMRQEAGDYVAVGVYKDGTKWWCTQTFAKKGDGNCPLVGGTSDNAAPVDPVPSYGTAAPTTPMPETASPSTSVPATTEAQTDAPVTTVVTASPVETYPESYETVPPPTQADCPHSREVDENTGPVDDSPSADTPAPSTTKPEPVTVAPSTPSASTTAIQTEAPVTVAAPTYPSPTEPEPSDMYATYPVYGEDSGSEDTESTSMCKKGVDLTNDLRRKYRGTGDYAEQGSGDLRIGTVTMLENAVTHSQRMMGDYGFNHQDLAAASNDVGCDLFVSGENIAMFYGMDTDPVEQCVKQWEESKPHLDGIMRAEAGDLVVVGIYHNVNGNNEYWCTQLFAKNGEGNCPMVGDTSDNDAPADPEPVVSTTSAPATTEISVESTVTALSTTYPSESYPDPTSTQPSSYGESGDTSESGYCKRATDVTNEIRRRYRGRGNYADQGQGDLMIGTQSMLDNAVSHSKKMANGSRLRHQFLSSASEAVGCDLFISAENIARTGGSADPVEQCMSMWENSEGHLNNIMGATEGDYVVVGVYNDGKQWWCTQTFAKKGEEDCPLVGGVSDNRSSGPVAPATDEYQTVVPPTTAPAESNVRPRGRRGRMYGANYYYGMRR